MQNLTNPFWTPLPTRIQAMRPQEGHLGFQIDIPYPPPVATPWYHGENPVIGRRELIMRADPEYFAVDNVIPYLTPNIPLVDIFDPSYSFDRQKYTFHV